MMAFSVSSLMIRPIHGPLFALTTSKDIDRFIDYTMVEIDRYEIVNTFNHYTSIILFNCFNAFITLSISAGYNSSSMSGLSICQ